MAKTPAEVRALIDQIAAEQKRFRESEKGTEHWYYDLSAGIQARIKETSWPREIVAMGKDDLEAYVKRLGEL